MFNYLQLDKDPQAVYAHAHAHGHGHGHAGGSGVRAHPGLQGFPVPVPVPAPPQYPDFSGYHHHHHPALHPGMEQPGAGAWSPAYPPPPARDDWAGHHYPGTGTGGVGTGGPGSGPGPGPGPGGPPMGFGPPEFPGQPLLSAALSAPPTSGSPRARRGGGTPYDWIRTSAPTANPNGKTRTKDKYRVVYTDHQRLELEKEFHYSKYITIRRKAELATALSLSERQVKIWFQNRRAKERKINKKKLQQPASSTTTTTPTPPAAGGGGGGGGGGGIHGGSSVAMVTSSSGNNGLVSPSLALNIKEEY